MGESYLPHSVLHEKVLTLRKLFVHLVHRPKVKSQESYRPNKTQGLCDPWSRGWALLHTFPTGWSTRLQYSTASQTATESYEDTINHVPDKKSGRGGWERRGALAGFYGIWLIWLVIILLILLHRPMAKANTKEGALASHGKRRKEERT